MTYEEVMTEVQQDFAKRKFSAGLAVAFIDFLAELNLPSSDIRGLDDFFGKFPRVEVRPGGAPIVTLVVKKPDDATLGIRPFYNNIENYFRAENKRFDYPSCAPHATQAWNEYTRWLDAMLAMSPEDLLNLRDGICKFVLDELPDQSFDPSTLSLEPPLFSMVLDDFDMNAHQGEPTGAAYQGIIFGFLRADNPHLQVEIRKVRTGGRRIDRIGDIDAWEGERLAITAEVKQYKINEGQTEIFSNFANEAQKRGSIGIVFTLGFGDGAREAIEGMGVRALDASQVQDIVSLWDPMKQRTAVASLMYYFKHVEQSSALTERLSVFLEEYQKSFQDSLGSES